MIRLTQHHVALTFALDDGEARDRPHPYEAGEMLRPVEAVVRMSWYGALNESTASVEITALRVNRRGEIMTRRRPVELRSPGGYWADLRDAILRTAGLAMIARGEPDMALAIIREYPGVLPSPIAGRIGAMRLTTEDRDAMLGAMRRLSEGWLHVGEPSVDPDTREKLAGLLEAKGCRAIGCVPADLNEAERLWVMRHAFELVASAERRCAGLEPVL